MVKDKINYCLALCKNEAEFISMFHPNNTDRLLLDAHMRESMVTTEGFPTLTIAKLSYGESSVTELIASHLQRLAAAFGIAATAMQIDMIAQDIISGYGYLKVSEIALFFKMLREGKFRKGDNDRGKMYGVLNGEVIMDCLYQFTHSYRDEILCKAEDELRKKVKEEADMKAASPQEKFEILTGKCLSDASFIEIIKTFNLLMDNEIDIIQKAVDEFKVLRLLRTRVEEYLNSINNGCDPKTNAAKLEKAISYLNEKFPKEQ